MGLSFPKGTATTRAIMAGVVTLATLSVAGTAFAYFTGNASAEGGFMLRLMPKTEIEETYGSKQKHVTISNASDSVPLYVRARAFSSMPVRYSGDGWEEGDDGWLYGMIPLDPGMRSPVLDVSITFPTGGTETVTNPDGTQGTQQVPPPATGDEHDVVVVYETAPVLYDESGNPLGPDECWGKSDEGER